MDKELTAIRRTLGHLSMDWQPSLWLDTGVPELNMVIGHRTKGIPFGRIIEMSGLPSHGKTAISMAIAALAQHMKKAPVIWGDLENSFECDWALQRGMVTCPNCKGTGRGAKGKSCVDCGDPKIKCAYCTGAGCPECFDTGEERGRGLDPSLLMLVQPYIGQFEESVKDNFGNKKKRISEPRLSTGTELCSEIEQCANAIHKRHDCMVIVVDSLASILTDDEAAAGIEGQNMKTSMSLPVFLGKLFRRWVGLAQSYNALILTTNQLRQSPNVKFGSPWYSPGGNAVPFYSHIRTRVMRTAGSKIVNKGKTVGIKGVMTAVKNKTGGLEGSEVGYRIMFDGSIEFVNAKEVKKKEGE